MNAIAIATGGVLTMKVIAIVTGLIVLIPLLFRAGMFFGFWGEGFRKSIELVGRINALPTEWQAACQALSPIGNGKAKTETLAEFCERRPNLPSLTPQNLEFMLSLFDRSGQSAKQSAFEILAHYASKVDDP